MGREYRISLACYVLLNGSTCQPFNANYAWFNTSDNLIIPDTSISALNTYMGAVYQQASSVVTQTSMRPFSAELLSDVDRLLRRSRSVRAHREPILRLWDSIPTWI